MTLYNCLYQIAAARPGNSPVIPIRLRADSPERWKPAPTFPSLAVIHPNKKQVTHMLINHKTAMWLIQYCESTIQSRPDQDKFCHEATRTHGQPLGQEGTHSRGRLCHI